MNGDKRRTEERVSVLNRKAEETQMRLKSQEAAEDHAGTAENPQSSSRREQYGYRNNSRIG